MERGMEGGGVGNSIQDSDSGAISKHPSFILVPAATQHDLDGLLQQWRIFGGHHNVQLVVTGPDDVPTVVRLYHQFKCECCIVVSKAERCIRFSHGSPSVGIGYMPRSHCLRISGTIRLSAL